MIVVSMTLVVLGFKSLIAFLEVLGFCRVSKTKYFRYIDELSLDDVH